MKKIISMCLALCLSVGCMVGCGSESSGTESTANNEEPAVTESQSTKVDFNQVYDDVVKEIEEKYGEGILRGAINVASDGSYLSVDTNPTNVDGGNSSFMVSIYVDMLETVNNKLGLSEATTNKMNHARALDGTQTVSDNNIKVTYLYHPDQGLEVMYENE